MKRSPLPAILCLGLLASGVTATYSAPAKPARATGWLNWRGPQQNGTSLETGLPETWTLNGANHLWEVPLSSRGAPVVANGRVYTLGYEGQGADLQEVLLCVDAETGKKLWEKRFSDFLSDVIYDRYSIGGPTVDPETGNVYAMTSAGLFGCYTADGAPVWQHSMFEQYGRLSFPNGRTGAPLIDDEYVIMRGITSNWGAQGAASDRFYAFDKRTGQLAWSSTPGGQPRENSFAMPTLAWQNGKRVFYTGLGDGSIACVNVRTGEPLWRFPLSAGGGVNASVVLHKGKVIAVQDAENIDSSELGRMVAIKVGSEPKAGETGPVVLDKTAEVWRNGLASFSSSPVLAGDRLYVVSKTGVLTSVDANNGKVLWEHKLGPDQLHASPLYADGKLYVPLTNGSFFILRPSDTGVKELAKVQLAGNCLGAPAVWNGKVYVHTTEKLYCFGKKGKSPGLAAPVAEEPRPKPGRPVALQIIPAEVVLQPGGKTSFTVRGIDANGFVTGTYDKAKVKWAKYIPPTAAVRAEMNGEFNAQGELVAGSVKQPSAGAFEATVDGLKGYTRGRVLPALPLSENFDAMDLSVSHMMETGVKFAYPPLPWIGARFRWEIREVDGNKVLAKTLDNVLFQRAQTFIGQPDMKNYTVEADVMTDGNRRIMSSGGVINQRYVITLNGNSQDLEVSSNHERIKVSVPFTWAPKEWYRLKTRVDVAPDGSGVVRAKAWKRGETEPAAWNIEVPHKQAHTSGSPGIFGFSPQSKFRVYIDNVTVTPNG